MRNFDNKYTEVGVIESRKDSGVRKSLFILLYIFIYQFIHVNYLSVTWDYIGYKNYGLDFLQVVLTFFFSLLPIYFYTGINKISSYFSIIIYLLAYVPIIITLSYNNTKELGIAEVSSYQLILSLSMIIFFSIDKIKTIRWNRKRIKIPLFWFHIIAGSMTLYLLVFFAGNMRFVGLTDVYELRFANSDMSNSISGYFIMWCTYFIYPIYFCIGLISKKNIYLVIGILGHIIIYMIMGAKASLIMPIVITSFYYSITKSRRFTFLQIVSGGLIILSMVLFLSRDITFDISSIFLMRTLGMPGVLFSDYLAFFSKNPVTHYSHINIINAFTRQYPYGDSSLGQVIGNYNSTNANANANFWATDGVAADGLLGIVIITIIMFFFLLWINNLFYNKKSIFYVLVFTGTIFSLLNVSFFTTLFSGGLLFLVITLMFFDFDKLLTPQLKQQS